MFASQHKVALMGGATGLVIKEGVRWAMIPVAGDSVVGGQLAMVPVLADSIPEVGKTAGVTDIVPMEPSTVLMFSDVGRVDAMIQSLTDLRAKMVLQEEVNAAKALLNGAMAARDAHQLSPVTKAE